jgi:tetratricopeptide (TPR) repeat protein
MTEPKIKFNLMVLILNSAAIGLACLVLTMDCSAFLFWLALGVFDGHWNDVSLQVLFVCLIISFLFLLIVSALFGLGVQIGEATVPRRIRPLHELGALIDSGWDTSLRTCMSCALVVLAVLAVFCISFWQDLLWWSEVTRGRRATLEKRPAMVLYEQSAEIATVDRKPISFIYLAREFYLQKNYIDAERYYQLAIEAIKSLPDDNKALLVTSDQELAQTMVRDRQLAKAEVILRQAIATFGNPPAPLRAVQMRLLGSLFIPDPNPGPTLIGSYTLLESVCIKQGKYTQAEKTFADNLNTFEPLPHPSIRAIIGITELYADHLMQARQNRDLYVDNAYSLAKKLVIDKFGADSEAVGRFEAAYGDRLKLMGRFNDAVAVLQTALAHLHDALKNTDPVELRTMNELAQAYTKIDRFDDAEKLYEEQQERSKTWAAKTPEALIQFDAGKADYAAMLAKRNGEPGKKQAESGAAPPPAKH